MTLSLREMVTAPPRQLVQGLADGKIAIATAFAELKTSSPVFPEALLRAQLVARYPTLVLLLGETGVGKTTVAAALHLVSRRRGRFQVVTAEVVIV